MRRLRRQRKPAGSPAPWPDSRTGKARRAACCQLRAPLPHIYRQAAARDPIPPVKIPPAAASVRSATASSLCKRKRKRGRDRVNCLHHSRPKPNNHASQPSDPTNDPDRFPLPPPRPQPSERPHAATPPPPPDLRDPGGRHGRAHGHRNRLRRLIPRVLLLAFALYAVSFAIYLLQSHSHHPSPPDPSPRTDTHDGAVRAPPYSSQKPWPRLPSFLPWVGGPAPPPHTCEAYFGNGFSRRVEVLPARGGGGGWFRCHHSETLGSSICEGARVRLDPARIAMSRGGEPLEQVMGRGEEEELPKYEPGALQVEGPAAGRTAPLVDAGFLNTYQLTGGIGMHTMRALLESARVVPPDELHCSQWIEEPTLLVTRFEYANLFHTITDWYSAYVSSRVTNLPNRPNVVFVDGHCKAQLEQTWEALFSSVTYAKNFSGPVCFRHAILSPLGYETAMFKGLSESFSCEGASAQSLRGKPDYEKTARLSEFGEMIVASFDLLQDDIMSSKKSNGLNVLFVRREDYLAHPRHSGKVESRLSNEREVYDAIEKWAKGLKCKVNVINGLFAHMNMKEQLRAILEASVVIGAHGAGLTHLVSATPDTKVLEIISSMYRRPHFALISHWKALEYHAINLPGSYARITDVINELSNILEGLGC